ncbi:MAG: LysM peptidoglycan-binding domain-containing protein [Desulfobacula sp.]|nr:LysM peptidoglycan-binding domain-containing protein [Desulfobacula sp.]
MRNFKSITVFIGILIFGFAIAPSAGLTGTPSGLTKDKVEFTPGEDSGFYYTIKKGDTLWDLSQKFYNSQWDWPGLWEMNDEIKNPHWIYPGRKIRIFLKEQAKLKPIIVPVKKVEKTVVSKKIKPSFAYSEMDYVGFIKKKKQVSKGKVIKEQDGHLLMNKNDIIYIKPSGKGTLIPGKIYHVFTATPIKEKIHKGIFEGVRHMIKAEIKILEHKTNYAVALITRGYRTVYEGDLIMDYYDRNETLTVEDNPKTIDARIISSEDKHLMINDYIIAFIDVGKSQVKPGQIYTVLRTNQLVDHSLWKKKAKNQIKLDNLKSGKLIVLHTEDIASTVMIMSSGYAIHPNDIVN